MHRSCACIFVFSFLAFVVNAAETGDDKPEISIICKALGSKVEAGGALDVVFAVQNNNKDSIAVRWPASDDDFVVKAVRKSGARVATTANSQAMEARPNRG